MKFTGGREGAPTICVRSMAGVKMRGASGSEEIGTKGPALIIATTSAIQVVKSSWVRFVFPSCMNIESRIACLLFESTVPTRHPCVKHVVG